MSVELDQSQAEAILRGIRIPPQPQILTDLQMEMVMPDFSLNDIAELIAKDVGLSGNVLKTINSPIFGMPSKITSIPQAISLLGLNSVVNIINAVALRDTLSGEDAGTMINFWDNAMDVAAACALIAKKLGIASADDAYTIGLFHNAAIPLLALKFKEYPQVLEQAYAEEERSISTVEAELLKTDHAAVAYLIARRWQLPQQLCEVIAEHHEAERSLARGDLAESEKKNLLAILKIAEYLCATYRKLGKQEHDYEFERLKPMILDYLSLTQIDIDDLRDDLSEAGIAN